VSGHRILWNERPSIPMRGLGDIDEIVIKHPATVHVEQMDDRCWWIGVYLDETAEGAYWMGNFVADSRGRMRFVEQENHNVEWAEDKSHEVGQ
jgi:hypothetical protein